jgi:hypothetical protein
MKPLRERRRGTPQRGERLPKEKVARRLQGNARHMFVFYKEVLKTHPKVAPLSRFAIQARKTARRQLAEQW